jgi:hypothetical protein
MSLAALFLGAFLCFAYPMYVIRPFRAQGALELSIALSVRRWGPWLALACAAASVPVMMFLRQRIDGRRSRIAAFTLSVAALVFAGLCQVNVYEFMFHPAGRPAFIAADKASIAGDDMVLAVSLSGQARAYPIREMGYHHIVNDWVGGEPIVSTY